MSLETIMWTVLPTGIDGRTLNFSLYLSPQLNATALLGTFPVFGVWTERAKSLAISLEIQGSSSPLLATLQLGGLSTPHWKRVFPDNTPVLAWNFKDQSGRKVQSYPVSETRALVSALYTTVAISPAMTTAHPPLTAGSPVLELVENLGRPMGTLLAQRQRL